MQAVAAVGDALRVGVPLPVFDAQRLKEIDAGVFLLGHTGCRFQHRAEQVGVAGAVGKLGAWIVNKVAAKDVVHPVGCGLELDPVGVTAAPLVPLQAGSVGQQVLQGDLVLAGILLFQHLRQVVGEQVVYPADVPLLDGDADQGAGEGFGGGV